ncbi:gp436 family protein [Undibacterium sp. TJN25]|uniref:gp436 family protein n=1 Tax=Undibacterium sp. TJN25 TaxID=3413056 RepID=UPI003BF413FD
MTYATRPDLEKRYSADEIAQRESALEAGAVDSALEDADALIDGYLAGRYSLPMTTVPDILVQTACALARYGLLGEAATDRARNDQRDALAWLKDVQAGRVLLQAAVTVPGNAPEAIVMLTAQRPVFGRMGRP